MEALKTILSAGVGAGLMTIILAVLQRYWEKKDEKEKIDPALFKALVAAQKVTLVDRVRYLGTCYIGAKQISIEDKENLKEMHEAYKALGGNGHLDTVMAEVDKLPVIDGRYK